MSRYPKPRRFWVGYSGGLDSHVLLHCLFQLYQLPAMQSAQTECRIVHVHHGLHPSADDWVEQCRQTARLLEFPCTILYVDAHSPRGASPEEYARQARYTALSALLISDEEVLLTAHHADDQAETLLLQLLRGSGPAGLAAMPTRTRLGQGWLLRPLLHYTRAQLYDYARKHQLQWIEDSSNCEIHFDRNYLRHQILPKLQARWPSVVTTLNRVAQHQAETQELLDVLAQHDFSTYNEQNDAASHHFNLTGLRQLSPTRQRNVLRYWLKQFHAYQPTTAQLQQIMDMMLTAQADRHPIFKWNAGEIHRHQNHLVILPKLPPPPGDLELIWQLSEKPLILPLGQLIAIPVHGRGLNLAGNSKLQICFRQGGEQIYVRGHQHAVKKLFQAASLAAWQRPYFPLIYLDNILIMLPEIGINDHYRATLDQSGWDIFWVLPEPYNEPYNKSCLGMQIL